MAKKWQGPRQCDYPKEIVVGDSIYRLRFVRTICNTRSGSDKETLGLCCPSEKEILIKQGLEPQERLSTLIHEILHCIEFEFDVELPHKLIYQLEGPLTQILLDNQP